MGTEGGLLVLGLFGIVSVCGFMLAIWIMLRE